MTVSYVYHLDGSIEQVNDTYNEMPYFKKITNCEAELTIVNMLSTALVSKPTNIVNIYYACSTYYIMELVNTVYELDTSVIDAMLNVKAYLQSVNIAYIDWKPDNIGIGQDGTPKLFDFDGCGIFNDTKEWIIQPFKGYAFREARGLGDPVEIDDYCFNKYLRERHT